MEKLGFSTIVFAHILLIPWTLILNLSGVAGRYGAFVLALYLFLSMPQKERYLSFAKNRVINILVLSLTLCIAVTSFKVNELNVYDLAKTTYASKYENNGIAYGLATSFKVLVSFLFIQYIVDKNGIKTLFCYLFYTVLFYTILVDLSIVLFGIQENGSGYLIGNKFTVSYLHMFLAVLYQIKQKVTKKSSRNYSYFLLWALVASFLVHCSTAVMGGLLLLVFNLSEYFKKITYKPIACIVLILSSVLFAFFYQFILDIPFVQYVIVDILGEDLTLTGRIYIYDAVMQVIETNPLWGYGIGNSYQLLHFLYNYPNAQNGFINLFLEQGILGSVITLALVIVLMYHQVKNRKKDITYSMICLLYTLIVMAFVEITIDLCFVFLLTLLQITDKNILYSISKQTNHKNENLSNK